MEQSTRQQDTSVPIKLGFIGGGVHSAVGYTHYVASRLDRKFELVAGCFSSDDLRNQQSAERYGVEAARTYHNIDEFIASERGCIPVVSVLTPTPHHCSDVKKLLEAGFKVICEKALATSVEEAEQIDATLKANGAWMGVTFNYSGYPMVREARELIASGTIGKLQQVYCEMPQETFSRLSAQPQVWRLRDYEIPCVSLDLGVHVHHMVHFLSGGAACVEKYERRAGYGRVTGVVDTCIATAQYDRGLLVQMMWSKAVMGQRNGLSFRAIGSDGTIQWRQADPETLHLASSDGAHLRLDMGSSGLLVASDPRYARFKPGHPAGFIEAFANVYSDFHDDIKAGQSDTETQKTYGIEAALTGLRFLQSENGAP